MYAVDKILLHCIVYFSCFGQGGTGFDPDDIFIAQGVGYPGDSPPRMAARGA